MKLWDRLNLGPEMDDPHRILEAVSRDVTFRGINLWVLITATLVASVGLNVNSTAVIIGAMLISPLMGPINGVGVSLAIYDIALFRKSLRNLVVAVLFSLLTSAGYFALTPLKEAGTELLARTTPTFWDVLIAFFGGLSGAIATLGREKRTNVIAGVAIATALMPPLCTAGYGIGTLQLRFFAGALYLFLINAVFISASAYLTFQAIRFPNREFIDKTYQLRIRRLLAGIAVLTLLPSIYVAYTVVKDAVEEARVRRFVENAFSGFPTVTLVEQKRTIDGDSVRLRLVLVGDLLTPAQIAYLQHELRHTYHLPHYTLEIVQGTTASRTGAETAKLAEVAERSFSELRRLSDSLNATQNRLAACEKLLQETADRSRQLSIEIQALFPEVERAGAQVVTLSDGKSSRDTLLIVVLGTKGNRRLTDEKRLLAWLSERTGHAQVRLAYK